MIAEWPHLFPNRNQAQQKSIVQTINTVRDLELGMTGEDVRLLQQLLNMNGFVVSQSGVGSLGNETNFFGMLTRSALSKFQETHNIAPSAGYFGPKTRDVMKSLNLKGIWW